VGSGETTGGASGVWGGLAVAEGEVGPGLEQLLGMKGGAEWALATLDRQLCQGS
jgi:hypothetical protein